MTFNRNIQSNHNLAVQKNTKIKFTALSLIATLILSSCASLPDVKHDVSEYKANDTWTEQSYANEQDNALAKGQETNTSKSVIVQNDSFRFSDEKFWEGFYDENLNQLINLALKNNKDFKTATYNLQNLIVSRANVVTGIIPSFSGNIGSSRKFGNLDKEPQSYSGSLSISYQTDLFGKLKEQYKSLNQNVLGGLDEKRNVYLSVTTQVTSLYWQIVTFNEKLDLYKDILQNMENTLKMTKVRYKTGAISEIDYLEAQQNYRSTQKTVLSLQEDRSKKLRELAILVGVNPQNAEKLVQTRKLAEYKLPILLDKTPSWVLENRPDVAQRLKQLLSDVHLIDSNRQAFFPDFSLSYGLGSSSIKLSQLFKDTVNTLGINLLLPFLDFPQKQLNLRSSQIQYQKDLVAYRDVLYKALKEVEDSRQEHLNLLKREKIEQEQFDNAKKLLKMNKVRYEVGADSMQHYLNAQNDFINSQMTMLDLKLALYQNFLTRYMAIGGDKNNKEISKWLDETEKTVQGKK